MFYLFLASLHIIIMHRFLNLGAFLLYSITVCVALAHNKLMMMTMMMVKVKHILIDH